MKENVVSNALPAKMLSIILSYVRTLFSLILPISIGGKSTHLVKRIVSERTWLDLYFHAHIILIYDSSAFSVCVCKTFSSNILNVQGVESIKWSQNE